MAVPSASADVTVAAAAAAGHTVDAHDAAMPAGVQLQHGSAAGYDPSAAPAGHDPVGRPQAPAPGAKRRSRSASPAAAPRGNSRSPRGRSTGVAVPVSPESADAAWHEAKPGPASSLDEVRFWSIREIGKIQETNKFTGKHIRILMNEVDTLKKQMATKSDAIQVVHEFDKVRSEVQDGGQRIQAAFDQLRQQFGDELAKTFVDIDSVGTNAKLTNLGDLVNPFGA